jgi:hypothetical protein
MRLSRGERIVGLYNIAERMCKSGVPADVFVECGEICQTLWGAYHNDQIVNLMTINDRLIILHRGLDAHTKERMNLVEASGDLK